MSAPFSSMPSFSFRFKLLLAMMVLVMGVTGTTLFLTQKRVRQSYQQLFADQFQTQINYFADKQEARLQTVKERCQDLTRSVRVLSALNLQFESAAGELEPDAVADLYRVSFDELRELLGNPLAPAASKPLRAIREGKPLPLPGNRQPIRAMSASFFRFLDRNGRVLAPPHDPRAGLIQKGAGKKRLEQQLAPLSKVASSLRTQEVGYLTPENDSGKTELLEIVMTPVIDQVENRSVGTLIIGFPVPDFGENLLREMSEIRSGIWLDGQLYSKSIPETSRTNLAEQVAQEIKKSRSDQGEVQVEIGVQNYQLFVKPLNEGSQLEVAYHVGLYSLEKAMRDQNELRTGILTFGLVALMGALAIGVVLSHNLTTPLNALAEGTQEIQSGNFGVRIPVVSNDEFGKVTRSFNEMAEGLAQRERYRSVLNAVVDKNVAADLVSGKIALGGEVREMSVIFCDIRGFTALTQDMPPDEVIQMLNEHMTALNQVVHENNGVVDKFVGDLIMAIFGAPKSYGNDALDAARCALGMIEQRARLNQTSRHKIEVGIGVATGSAVAGCMGSSDRLNYTVLGERVNLGARLCSQAGRMEVVIDQTTRDRLGDQAEVTPLPDLKLKGFSYAVKAYKLTALRTQPVAK